MFATTTGQSPRLESDASYEEIFATGRARIDYERDLTLKDKLRTNKKLEKVDLLKVGFELHSVILQILAL